MVVNVLIKMNTRIYAAPAVKGLIQEKRGASPVNMRHCPNVGLLLGQRRRQQLVVEPRFRGQDPFLVTGTIFFF